jgi:uncharacterized membrane protein HdeD (DUF308 family)
MIAVLSLWHLSRPSPSEKEIRAMSTNMNLSPECTGPEELQLLRKEWGWFLALGISLVVMGMIAIGNAFAAMLFAVVLLGSLLLIAGLAQCVTAFNSPRWSGVMIELLMGLLYFVVGALTLSHPVGAAASLTMLFAMFLIFGGIFRIVLAMQHKFRHWGWTMLNGLISLLLGLFIWKRLDSLDAVLLIGLFVGIELLFNGMTWILLALTVRKAAVADES